VKHNRAFHEFGQAKFPPPKILLDSKVAKIDPKIIISPLISLYVPAEIQGEGQASSGLR